MAQILFQSDQDINNEWLFYIFNEAKSLAQRDEFAIENYMDREIFNPDTLDYLNTEEAINLFDGTQEASDLNLNYLEGMKSLQLPDWSRFRFRKLKAKVKKIFCHTVRAIGELDEKEIIKAVLLALIPAFASGLPAAVLPILIGLLAYLFKYGIERTCPV